MRLAFFFAVTGYSYVGKPGGLWSLKVGPEAEVLCNSVVFTWGFLEMLWWFWVGGHAPGSGLLRLSADGEADLCDGEG